MKAMINKWAEALRFRFGEERAALRMLQRAGLGAGGRAIDIGCGYGRLLRVLRANGIDAEGVDINPGIVQSNLKDGLPCLTVEEFRATDRAYDGMIMSHVIEHLPSGELLKFLDYYVGRLKKGGRLLIATPLENSRFYYDFDHVRAYPPAAVMRVFGDKAIQMQYCSRHYLELRDIWFGRVSRGLLHTRGLYLEKGLPLARSFNNIMHYIFIFSFGIIGRRDRWVGLFEKMSD